MTIPSESKRNTGWGERSNAAGAAETRDGSPSAQDNEHGMPDSPQTVGLIDDDASFLASAGQLLRRAGFAVEAYPAVMPFLAGARGHLDCLVLDMQMPGMAGPDLLRFLEEARCQASIVFVTDYADLRGAVDAIKRGASDVILKPVSAPELLASVTQALDERRTTSSAAAQVLRARTKVGRLTNREWQVARLVADGLPNKQIAVRLGAAEKTVKNHRAAVMRKLQAESLADLIKIVSAAVKP